MKKLELKKMDERRIDIMFNKALYKSQSDLLKQMSTLIQRDIRVSIINFIENVVNTGCGAIKDDVERIINKNV